MKIALTIAGSDSGGGAGIQADLKTFHQFGVFGTSVVTAITAQNTLGVRSVHAVPGTSIDEQLTAVAEDLSPDALKTGMLADRQTVTTVADAIRRWGWSNYVLDPVMVATSGDALHTEDTAETMLEELVPLATVMTPNAYEAERLTGTTISGPDDLVAAGHMLMERGANAVVITGGDGSGDQVVDLLVTPEGVRLVTNPRISTMSTHGTGCTLSAAIAAGLAHGRGLTAAVAEGIDFVHRAIAGAPGLGAGHGPLNHTVAPPHPDA